MPVPQKEALLEARLLQEVGHHPNVVRLFGLMQWNMRLGVVMELANHPCQTMELLMDAIASNQIQWRRGDAYNVALGVAAGLAHIHDKRGVHRDLKREQRRGGGD